MIFVKNIKKCLTKLVRYDKLTVPLKEGYFFVPSFTISQREVNNPNGGAVMRVKITLSCTECKQRNYNTMKDKKNTPDRLERNKYCRFCKKHTLHRETK